LDAGGKEAIEQLGPHAIPFLLRRMPEYRAVDGFRVLGAQARSAIPDLARMATNYAPVREQHYQALVGIGPESLGVLSTIATNEVSAQARLNAVDAIGSLGTNARPAVPVLIQCLKEQNEDLLNATFLALRMVRPNQLKDFQTIADFLDNPKARVRSDALEALASFGEKASEPAIIALRDHDVGVRYTALGVLIQYAPHFLTNSAVLVIGSDGLKKSIGNRQKFAAQLLRAAGQQSQGVRPDLTVSWPGEWSAVFQEATNTLLRLAPQLLKDPSP
jgi:HEAT repeat protein